MNPCPSCPPAPSLLCILTEDLRCVPPLCLPGLEQYNHERAERQTRNSEAQALAVSRPGVTDPLRCAMCSTHTGGQGRIRPKDSRKGGHLRGHMLVQPQCKIECCPPKPKFWGCHPGPPHGTAPWAQMLLKRKQQHAHTHTHTHARTHVHTHESSHADCAKGLHPSSASERAVACLSLGADPLILLLKTWKAFSGGLPYQQRKECSGSLVWSSLGGSSTWVGMSGSSTGREGARGGVGGHKRRRSRSGNGRSPGPAGLRSE